MVVVLQIYSQLKKHLYKNLEYTTFSEKTQFPITKGKTIKKDRIFLLMK